MQTAKQKLKRAAPWLFLLLVLAGLLGGLVGVPLPAPGGWPVAHGMAVALLLLLGFALPPLITMLAQSFGFMIAGSAMVESVFSIPGLGDRKSVV